MSGDQTPDVDWPSCGKDGCIGAPLRDDSTCLAHAKPEVRSVALKRLGETGELDVRGVPIAPGLLEEILAAAPHNPDDRPAFTIARFSQATFHGDASFRGATFDGDAKFDGATFHGDAKFDGATFHGDAVFGVAVYRRVAASSGATFHGDASFREATFRGDAWFGEATFHGDTRFDRVIFHRDVSFSEARFHKPVDVGPIAVAGWLDLDRILFDQPVQLEAAARHLSCNRTRFRAGGHLRVSGAKIGLEDAEIPTHLILAGQLLSQAFAARVPWLTAADEPMPSLATVQRADVAGLVVASIDLRACHLAGAHNLDQLQFTSAALFPRAPTWHGRGRRVLAEEGHWRQARGGWRGRHWRQTTSARQFRSYVMTYLSYINAADLAGIYRQLRKGMEDAKNEPGAADFYFGECEMRRHAVDVTPWAERAILWWYWAVSGYGLRGARALGWLAGVLAGFALAFQQVGFGGGRHPGLLVSLVYTALGAVSVESRTTAQLTVHLSLLGEALRIVLRVLGPVLLGLAALSIRNRIKR
jgi:uncharacterized protein YjbI with pentapeptide repeats